MQPATGDATKSQWRDGVAEEILDVTGKVDELNDSPGNSGVTRINRLLRRMPNELYELFDFAMVMDCRPGITLRNSSGGGKWQP